MREVGCEPPRLRLSRGILRSDLALGRVVARGFVPVTELQASGERVTGLGQLLSGDVRHLAGHGHHIVPYLSRALSV